MNWSIVKILLLTMNKLKKLYHGSNVVVSHPNIYAGKPRHDFGRAFYLTTDFEQAKKWSKHKIRRNPVCERDTRYNFLVSKYFIKEKTLNSLNIKEFKTPSEEWLNYVIHNRTNIEFALLSDYDIVIGPVVDGTASWVTLNQYINKKISFEETLKLIKPRNLTNQWAFKTITAINLLEYGGIDYEK